jgi:hypothetical protein
MKAVLTFPNDAQKEIQLGRSQHFQRTICWLAEHVGHILSTRPTCVS